ncbi:uncharacterized protein [Dendrobates tinctorius]|uniref:uncharacterized protein n=1 Tax=Dendrobates tinctorius TaxID=92724 RepID=UPI003CC9ED1D
MWTDLQGMVNSKVIVPVPPTERGRGHYSSLFSVAKASGEARTIINLKPLNAWVRYKRFQMESIRSAVFLIDRDAVMCTLDLKKAYYQVPIHPSSQRLLRFAVSLPARTCHLQFQCLPFGLASAPRILTKLVMEMVAYLRDQGIVIIPYLDYLLLVAKSEEALIRDRNRATTVMESLGWVINWTKSDLRPETKKVFLGVLLDSASRISRLPKRKQKTIQARVGGLLEQQGSIREAMEVLGLMTACIPCVRWAQFHSRSLQREILAKWDRRQTSLDKPLWLPERVKESLRWWTQPRNLQVGVLWITSPYVIVSTDSSTWGWGAHIEGKIFQGR